MLGNQMNAQAAHQAEQERMKRLEWQFKAQEHEDRRAEVLRKQKALEAFGSGFNVTPQQGPLMGPGGTPTTGTSDQNAIGGIESGGRYDAVGPAANSKGQRAYGKYQIMDFNIGPWTQEVLGKPMTPQEFLANPQAQDAVFNAKFGQYSQKYGPVGASRAWFAGEGGMNNPNASDVNGMTVQRYGDQFAKARGVASAPVGPPPVGLGGAGPTLSALPAFEGPGTGTIQPGALPKGGQPSVNLPAPAPAPAPVPPPQVAQGDAVTPGGSPINPNAPPPAFMQPGGPNVVQAQYAPQPGQPTMAPGGAPASGGVDAPPQRPVTPMPQPDPALVAQVRAGMAAGVITPEQGLTMVRQNVMDKFKRLDDAVGAQHSTALEVYRQQQETRRFERGQEAQQWDLMTPQQAQMKLGPAYDPTKAYQVNKKGEIKPVGGAQTVVNIDQKGEQEFGKEMGKMDAKRFGDIIQAEGTMNDMASKLSFALEQFKQTYTGPGAESANAFYKTLGAVGFEEAAKKANAADAAMAVISQMKPAMRAPGTGSSSDRDMDTFARALPSLLNLPGGNERITAYFQRMADRATRVRELAQEHSDGGKTPLTRTGFDKAVKELGPLFTPAEVKEMTALGKTKPTGPKPPLDSFGATPQQTPAPPGSLQPRPPIGSFGGGR
jgi:hypothetical protein